MSDYVYVENTQLVASEIIDSEAVIINLADGMYYTLDQVGSDVWHLLNQGCTFAQLVSAIATHYDKCEENIVDDLKSLLDDLLSNQLITHSSHNSHHTNPTALSEKGSIAYSAPTLYGYSDMNEVLALDPPLPEIGAPGLLGE